MEFLSWSYFVIFNDPLLSLLLSFSGGLRPFILYSSLEFLHPYTPYTRKPAAIQTENLIQVCQESLVVRRMLIRTEEAGSQGTSGTENGGVFGSWE